MRRARSQGGRAAAAEPRFGGAMETTAAQGIISGRIAAARPARSAEERA